MSAPPTTAATRDELRRDGIGQVAAALPMPKVATNAAQTRLAAVATLHQPVQERIIRDWQCRECRKTWPCPTAYLLGLWA